MVLAARSPVFRFQEISDDLRSEGKLNSLFGRAMLLNDMEESTRARVEPKEFNSQTMSMLLKFLYTGAIEQVPVSPGRTLA